MNRFCWVCQLAGWHWLDRSHGGQQQLITTTMHGDNNQFQDAAASPAAELLRNVNRQARQHLVSTVVGQAASISMSVDDYSLYEPWALEALVNVCTAAEAAQHAADKLRLLLLDTCDSTAATDSFARCSLYDATAQVSLPCSSKAAKQMLHACKRAALARAEQQKQYQDALVQQMEMLQRAREKRLPIDEQEYKEKDAKAAKAHPQPQDRKEAVSKLAQVGGLLQKVFMDLTCSLTHRQAPVSRRALPAGAYYDMMSSFLHDTQQEQQQPASSPAHRLQHLCSMMNHNVAPFHLAMSHTESMLAVLQSLPWLRRTRARLQLVEQYEFQVLMQQWDADKQQIAKLTGKKQVAAVVAASRSARQQLLLFVARRVVAADDASSSTGSASGLLSNTWQGVSWVLFPDGLKRELDSLTDRWRSCPDSTMAVVSSEQQLGRDASATASYLQEVRAYSTSPYPSFDDMLQEELRSSISAHNLSKGLAASRACSSPAAAKCSKSPLKSQLQLTVVASGSSVG